VGKNDRRIILKFNFKNKDSFSTSYKQQMKGLFKFLGLTKEVTKSQTLQKEESSEFPKFNYKLEFLKALDKSPISNLFGLNTYWEARYRDLLGDLSGIIKKLKSDDLLEVSLVEEALTVPELKQILVDNNLSTSGNKVVLATRVFESVKNKNYLINKESFYKITQKGKEQIKSYRDIFDNEYCNFLHLQASLFAKGNIKEFESNHFRVKDAFPDQRSLGPTFNTFSGKTQKILAHLVKGSRFLYKWDIEEGMQSKLRSAIALRSVNFNNNEAFLSESLKDLTLSGFRIFAEKSTTKLLTNTEILQYAIEFEHNYLWNLYTLEELKEISKSESRSKKFIGVQILNDGCECQNKFNVEKFLWKDLKSVPVLPRTASCRCLYNAFREE